MDFESVWRERLDRCLRNHTGEGIAAFEVNEPDPVSWTAGTVLKMADALGDDACRDVLTGCACRYPTEDLSDVRAVYVETGSVADAHAALAAKFERFLRETLVLDDSEVGDILSRGWGLAGVLDGDIVIATKIPKSGTLREYFAERDPAVRRRLYCHCPRVRDAALTPGAVPALYCWCGAGFYKGVWEDILGEPVRVEVLESVLHGGDVCRIAIHLPIDAS
jgi:hypothetical protein